MPEPWTTSNSEGTKCLTAPLIWFPVSPHMSLLMDAHGTTTPVVVSCLRCNSIGCGGQGEFVTRTQLKWGQRKPICAPNQGLICLRSMGFEKGSSTGHAEGSRFNRRHYTGMRHVEEDKDCEGTKSCGETAYVLYKIQKWHQLGRCPRKVTLLPFRGTVDICPPSFSYLHAAGQTDQSQLHLPAYSATPC